MASGSVGTINTAEIRERYAQERNKRLRPDGNDQYLEITGALSHYLDDPYTERREREPVTDHVTVAVIGAGFAGLVTGARLKEAGIADVRLIEKGGDVGGTWYWNRYPGAQCDTAAMIYLPLLEETGRMPSEKYVHGPEILTHCQAIAEHYDLYNKALFHTCVTAMNWDAEAKLWRISTDRGDAFTAKYVTMGTGPLHVPKLPGIPGLREFKGHSFHTSRWDYEYTGGNPEGAPLDKLGDKRVAIIGTGATAVQCVPHLARACKTLYVCQRTPSSVDTRNNEPIDPQWFKSVTAETGWQDRWLENFAINQTGGMADEDLVQDGWTDLSKRILSRIVGLPPEKMTPENMLAAFEDADHEKMSEIRQRASEVVDDPETGDKLKAWYRQLCKRPCFHDEFLQAFNEPATVLLDTDGQGVEAITEHGIVIAGKEYAVDCIVYASGFEVGTPHERRAGFDMQGVGNVPLSQHWKHGMRSLHGVHVHGYPNAFLVQMSQGANLVSNYPHNLTEAARTVAAVIRHAEASGSDAVEATAAAEASWLDYIGTSSGFLLDSTDCTPGYYNNEGKERDADSAVPLGHPEGAVAYFTFIKAWRESGEFEGLTFT